ncbi:hypothetical protein [Oligoflexus tunisiensis]|uniref:hypothetical protein n=1 Tax=Oligoflexus tunisiensis TaxID=708132 RepID=UPI00114CECC9|nr:hypothetical protein [Oligoflexus tunisiensis]
MKFKKSVTALALTASSSAFALMRPPVETKTICLDMYESAEGAAYAGTCDQSDNNETLKKKILENGCAEGQLAMTAQKWDKRGEFYPSIHSCLPPNVAQL